MHHFAISLVSNHFLSFQQKMQACPLGIASEASTLFNRYLVRGFATSEHVNVNTASALASGEVKGPEEPNLADPSKKSVRGGVSYIHAFIFLYE